MKKKFRSLLALAMALAMVLALTACGSSSSDSDTVEETDGDESAVVVYDIDSSTEYEEDYGEDTSADYEEEPPQYIEVSVGDVLYSDDNCSVTLTSLEANDKGGSTLTLSVDSNYEGSLSVAVCAYDTDEFNSEVEKYYAGGSAYYKPAEQNAYFLEEGETEADWVYEFSGEYIYFSIVIEAYTEFLTQEKIDSGEAVDLFDELLYGEFFLVSTAE